MSDQTHGRFDRPHRHYELRDPGLRRGSSPWAWIVPALFALGIILALAFVGSQGDAPETVHPGGAGAPVTATEPAPPAQPVQPNPAD